MTMIKKSNLLIAALGLGLSSAAFAVTDNGTYLGAQLGQANSNWSKNSGDIKSFYNYPSFPGAHVRTKDFAGRVYGGYQFNKFISAELGYTYLGKTDFDHILGVHGADAKLTQQAGDLTAKLNFPVANKFDLFALGGAAYLYGNPSVSSTAKAIGVRDKGSSDAIRPTYGFGASYDINPHVSVDASWRQFNGGGNFENVNFTALGLSYHFI